MIGIAILIGITAYVFSIILLDPDMIFGWVRRILEKLPNWLSKPLGMCEYCLAGQMAFWYYLVVMWNDYNVITHIFFISTSIITVEIINILKK